MAEDIARGAQVYVRDLRDRLQGDPDDHLVLTFFHGEDAGLAADVALGVVPGRWGRHGVDPRVVRKLRREMQRIRPDVVIAHGGEPLKYAVVARPPASRLVYYRIGTVTERIRRQRTSRSLHSWLAGRADVVAAVSADVLEESHTVLRVSRRKLRLIPNGRDPARFTLRAHAKVEAPRLIFVGRMTTSKRPTLFLDVVSEVRRTGVDVEAVMVGDGPLLGEVRRLAKRAGVTVLGRRTDVPTLLAESDIFLFTSRAEGEGLPGVLIEAGMTGLALVATDVPGARDVIEEGETGFLVDVEGGSSMVDRVQHLCLDVDLRRRLGAGVHRRCVERFSMDASVAAWRSLLEDLYS